MFIRVKSTPNSPRKSVQIVKSRRTDGKVRQRIKAEMLHEHRPALFPPEQVAKMAIESIRKAKQVLPIDDLSSLYEEQRVISGLHEVYGHVYRDIGLDHILPAKRQKVSNRILHHTVLPRMAHPASKRSRVRLLKQDFGVSMALEKAYRMMDFLDANKVFIFRTP